MLTLKSLRKKSQQSAKAAIVSLAGILTVDAAYAVEYFKCTTPSGSVAMQATPCAPGSQQVLKKIWQDEPTSADQRRAQEALSKDQRAKYPAMQALPNQTAGNQPQLSESETKAGREAELARLTECYRRKVDREVEMIHIQTEVEKQPLGSRRLRTKVPAPIDCARGASGTEVPTSFGKLP